MNLLLRELGLGRGLYHLWHRPHSLIQQSIRAGGPIEQWKTARGQRAMEAAARKLPLLPEQPESALKIHVLTGHRFWYQTVFCLWSFAHQAGRNLEPWIYDDGSLRESDLGPLARLFPRMHLITKHSTCDRLDERLPYAKFPRLRERWLNYPNIRKLIDVHLGSAGWKLVLDSDLLFFKRPDFLISWLDQPDRPLHAVDSETSYGYPHSLMSKLAGHAVGDLVNVGLCGLKSDKLDWEQLEHWCDVLIGSHGTHYFLEQALVAMLVSGQRCAVAPATEYVTYPQKPEDIACQSVMNHYVSHSKRWYFRYDWLTAAKASRK